MANENGVNWQMPDFENYFQPCWSFMLNAIDCILSGCENVESKGVAIILTSALVSNWCGYGYANYASGATAVGVFFYSQTKKLHDNLLESRNNQQEIEQEYNSPFNS